MVKNVKCIEKAWFAVDRDSKYCSSFAQVVEARNVKTLALPPRMGEGSLRRALRHYEAHYHEERNHQGKNNVLLFPLPTQAVAVSGAAGRPAEIL